MTLSRSANTHLSETRVHWDGLSRPESANLQRTTKAIALSTKTVCMPVFGIDLAAARAPQCARQDKPEPTCRAWYKSPVWKAIKRHRLSQEPNCRQCAQEGCFITATHVAHVAPPGDQWSRFMDYANTQSLCSRHHNAQRRPSVNGTA